MKRVRRVTLAMLALSILAVSLAFNSGAAHAQTRAVLTSDHTAIAADTQSFAFNAWWGSGVCLSESDTKAFINNVWNGRFNAAVTILGVVSSGLIAKALTVAYWLDYIYLASVDSGRGDCISLAWGYIPWYWGR